MSGNYIHGYDPREQERLQSQAKFLENKIYEHIDFPPRARILEVGCGTGAQLEILLKRFPGSSLVGVDLSEQQLMAARERLAGPIRRGEVHLCQMDASKLSFSEEFDGAFLCWMLEHVANPVQVMASVLRALKPGAVLHVTEVHNTTLFFNPELPAARRYWEKYNALQAELGGDPFVGAKLGNILKDAGFGEIQVSPRSFHFDSRTPGERRAMFAYWLELLSSALPELERRGRLAKDEWKDVTEEMHSAAASSQGVFYYAFFQARAHAGRQTKE